MNECLVNIVRLKNRLIESMENKEFNDIDRKAIMIKVGIIEKELKSLIDYVNNTNVVCKETTGTEVVKKETPVKDAIDRAFKEIKALGYNTRANITPPNYIGENFIGMINHLIDYNRLGVVNKGIVGYLHCYSLTKHDELPKRGLDIVILKTQRAGMFTSNIDRHSIEEIREIFIKEGFETIVKDGNTIIINKRGYSNE